MAKYGTKLTTVGIAKLANAQVSSSKVQITHIAVGDGNGVAYTPTGAETALKREQWRGTINKVEVNEGNTIIVEGIVPATVGGFTMREVGLYDADGVMIAVGNYPGTEKTSVASGVAGELILRTIIKVANTSTVDLTINADVVTATKSDIDGISAQLAQTAMDISALPKDKSNGTTDNYADLVTLITDAKAKKTGLYVPNGTFYCSEDLVIDGIRNIVIDGVISMAQGKTLEICGEQSTSPSYIKVRGVHGTLKLSGLFNSKIDVGYAENFLMFANRQDSKREACAYNTINIGTVMNLMIDSENLGWITDNIFIGGRVNNFEMDGDYSHNNNIFNKTTFENSTIHIKKGHANHFKDCRFEGTNNITCDEGTYDNTFARSWSSNSLTQLADRVPVIVDNGSNNIAAIYADAFYHTVEVAKLNIESKNYKLENIYPIGGKLRNARGFQNLIETGKIEVTCDFGVLIKCDQSILRASVRLYDENLNIVTTKEAVLNSSLNFLYDATLQGFQVDGNHGDYSFAILKNKGVKYVEVVVRSGNASSRNVDFHRLSLHIKYPKISKIDVKAKAQKTNAQTEYFRGEFKTGDVVENSLQGQGKAISWHCVSDGYSGTYWYSNTGYIPGDLVFYNNNVYVATTTGTSGTVAPSHTSGTANDGTVTWEYLGQRATFVANVLNILGTGAPNGTLSAVVGASYTDTTNQKVYRKVSGTGNTGWKEVTLV